MCTVALAAALCDLNCSADTNAVEEVGGVLRTGGSQRPPVVCLRVVCTVCIMCVCVCQHLSWSVSEHSVSMSESYSEWPVGSLSGDSRSRGVLAREGCCVLSWNVSVRE